MLNIACCIMAAGKGARFHLPHHKLLIPIAGESTLARIIGAVSNLNFPIYVILHQSQPKELIDLVTQKNLHIVWMERQDGTGSALEYCLQTMTQNRTLPSHVLTINGDMPCLDTDTLRCLLGSFAERPDCYQMVTTRFPFPTDFGKVLETDQGLIIKENAECTFAEKAKGLENTGIYWFPTDRLAEILAAIPLHPTKAEKYITKLFDPEVLAQTKQKAKHVFCRDWKPFCGLNTTEDLMRIEPIAQKMLVRKWAKSGVHFKGLPAYMDGAVTIAATATIYPAVTLLGTCHIGRGAVLETGVVLKNATVGENTIVYAGSYIEDSTIANDCRIGPHAHLRGHTQIHDRCRIGNYVEMKNTIFGAGSKAAHLTYLGDCEVGQEANIGCGVITCNFDGVSKYQTIIEDGAFIGSDVQLIAPIRIGAKSYIASGSTITDDVEPGAFAIARSRQTTKPNSAARFLSPHRGNPTKE